MNNMFEYLYIPLIIILYIRTWKYKYLIDDFVPRGGYLLILGERPDHYSFYEKQRPILATVTNIGVFLATCLAIHHIFGWKVALLYALMPTNVSGVAWITGNYYASTVLLILVSYLYAISGTLFGLFSGMWFYVAALGSTVSAIPFAFIFPLIYHGPAWWIMFIPLFFFVFGNRFQTGLRLRKERHINIRSSSGEFSFNKIFVMTKVIAYYTVLNIWPSRLGFFHEFGKQEQTEGKLDKPSRIFWLSLVLNILFAYWSYTVSPLGMIWYYGFLLIFSQFTTFGQFIAERYLYISNIGFCIILASFISNPIIYTIICTLWFYRSHLYIKAWRDNKALLIESIQAFPAAPENYGNLGSHYLERKQYIKAVEPLLMASKYVTDNSFTINTNLSLCYFHCGQFDKSRLYLIKALETAPEDKVDLLRQQLRDIDRRINLMKTNKKYLKKQGII